MNRSFRRPRVPARTFFARSSCGFSPTDAPKPWECRPVVRSQLSVVSFELKTENRKLNTKDTPLAASRLLVALLLLVPTMNAVGDIEQRTPSSDFDAEFARAAERLEAGRRPEAEQALESIRGRSAERAWEARIALLLAADDLRRKDFAAAVHRLRLAPAASIGLEPYRRMLLGRALDAAGQ